MKRPTSSLSASLFSALLVCSGAAACNSGTPEAPTPEANAGSGAAAQAVEAASGDAPEGEPTSQPSGEATSQPTSQPTAQGGAAEQLAALARPPAEWVTSRVDEATTRLVATDAGRLIYNAIDAHGGLSNWYNQGPVNFRFRYAPVRDRDPIDTVQTIDTWRAVAVHSMTDNPDVRFGWDGEQAWVSDPTVELPTNPRFWALTPYYFMAVPFVLADPGVNLEMAGEEVFEGKTYDLVRATFGEGVGDGPEDYYITYVERDTHRIGGVRYVVSYPGFHPNGGHGAEKFMAYDGSQEVNGVTFAETFRTFSQNEDGSLNEVVTNTTLSSINFQPQATRASFGVPEGATVKEGY